MERTLTNFIRALRQAGAGVSTTEAIDAARAMDVIGYDDREVMKTALGTVLAKSVDEKEIHDRLFDMYFSRTPSNETSDDQDSDASSDDRNGAGEDQGDEADRFMDLANSSDSDRVAMALQRAGAQSGVDNIRFATQASFLTRKMMEQMGVKALEARLIDKLGQRGPEAEAEAEAMMAARSELQRKARAYVDGRFELFGKAATETFMNEIVTERAISNLSRTDMERMKFVVARMARRLAIKHSRRRKVRNRGQLDIRRTLRANAGHDFVPFDVVWKHKRKDKPKIVAVCDVSGSVAQYVRFLLLFLYMLREKVAEIETFAFSGQLKDVGDTLLRHDFNDAMNRIIFEIGSSSTDYGQSFDDLWTHHGALIDRRTTVLILGDGRSNNGNPRLDLMQELADKAKRVVWLCPEPEASWGSGDSCMLQYRPFCTHAAHVATAADIERAIDEMLTAYD